MWITEILEKETNRLLARIGHGTSYPDALYFNNVYMGRFGAVHSVHLFWEEE